MQQGKGCNDDERGKIIKRQRDGETSKWKNRRGRQAVGAGWEVGGGAVMASCMFKQSNNMSQT